MKELIFHIAFILVMVLGSVFSSIAQGDTIFLDGKFKPMEKGKHLYFRLIDKMPTGQYRIRDYYKSGNIQMAGYSDQPDADHLTGTVIRYNSDGSISSICEHKTYKDGWITFYDKNFIKASSLWCVRGKKNGVAYFYDEKGNQIAKGWFKNDNQYKGKMPDAFALSLRNPYTFGVYQKGKKTGLIKYYASGRKAMVAELDSTEYGLTSAKYFTQEGKVLGKCTYNNKVPVHGTHVEYYDKTFFSFKPAAIKYIESYVDTTLKERISLSPQGVYLGSCTYKYDAPLDGSLLRERVLEPFRDGQIEGEVVEWSADFQHKFYTYTVHNGMKNGLTTYRHPLTDSVFIGNYINDYPDTGFIYHRNELCYYTDAMKNGNCRKFDTKGNLVSITNYINNTAEGKTVSFTYPKLGPIEGWNKSGKPFSGEFANPDGQTIAVTKYEEGKQTQTKAYTRDSLVLFSYDNFEDQTILYYDVNGEIRFKGVRKNNKPFDGVFIRDNEESTYQYGRLNGEKRYFNRSNELIKSEMYRNDTLHGPYTVYKNAGTIEASGEYRNGKPYSGTFLEKDKATPVTYERGLIQGVVIKKEGPFTCHYNYIDGEKTGDVDCWKKIVRNSSDSTLVRCLMPDAKDTLKFSGFYVDGKPFQGTFTESHNLNQYVEGILHGCSFRFSSDRGQQGLIAEEQFDKGILHGEAVYYIKGKPLRSRFVNGQIMDGVLPAKEDFAFGSVPKLAIYKNGTLSGDSLITNNELEWLYKKGGLPYEGFKRRDPEYSIVDEYKNGFLVKTSNCYFGVDTFWSIVYHGDSSTTFDEQKNIIAKSIYSKPYSSGVTQYYSSGHPVKTIRFENGILQSGCLNEIIPTGRFMDGTKHIRLCKDSVSVSLLMEPGDEKRISKEIILPESTIIHWPFVFNASSVYNLLSANEKTEKFYDLETGKLLATYVSSQNGSQGTQISQNGNRYHVEHIHENGMESLELSYDELLAKLAEWNK